MMTREDYILLYLKDPNSLLHFMGETLSKSCPILREVLLEIGDSWIAETYALFFNIYDDKELENLILKGKRTYLWKYFRDNPKQLPGAIIDNDD